MRKLNIYELNERVWKSGATEIIKFTYLENKYHLIQTETPSKSAGNTYVYKEIPAWSVHLGGSDYEEYEPVLYINWQASGVHAYTKPAETIGPDPEGTAILHYLLSSDKEEYRRLVEGILLTVEISTGEYSTDDWLHYEYYGDGSDTFQF